MFVDANILAYARSEEDSELRARCRRLLTGIAAGAVAARTSASVVEELWHLELRGRPRLPAGTAQDALTVFTPVLPLTEEIVRLAMTLEVKGLGSNDRIHVATCQAARIDTIVTADAAFDEVDGLRRVDPGDHAAMEALLSA